MKQIIYPLIIASFIPATAFASLQFEGVSATPVEVTPAATTGLEKIYVLRSSADVRVAYSSAAMKWQLYGSAGGGYAEDVAADGGKITLKAGDTGLIVTDASGRQHCYWIVDYSRHELVLNSLAVASEGDDCDRTTLALDGAAEAIPYYTVTGRRDELSRELAISYHSQVFDEDAFSYGATTVEKTLDGAGALFGVEAPLCDTQFTLTGDRFLKAWGELESVTSDTYRSTAVAAETKAAQTEREVDNEQTEEAGNSLGGSAPCEIEFSAAVSDGVVFKEWQISRSAGFEIPDNTFNDETFTYTFTDSGTSYVRFIANNADGTCQYTGTVYEVFIGESKLDIPNAFSPGASPGVNDEWKVSYKSLVEFECHIFNKWGTKMCSMSDPSQSWDGKYAGKLVPAGTYYYVIKAKGSDGIVYNKSGDINIINYTGGTSSGEGSGENSAE